MEKARIDASRFSQPKALNQVCQDEHRAMSSPGRDIRLIKLIASDGKSHDLTQTSLSNPVFSSGRAKEALQ